MAYFVAGYHAQVQSMFAHLPITKVSVPELLPVHTLALACFIKRITSSQGIKPGL
jgi:hypothetical protein